MVGLQENSHILKEIDKRGHEIGSHSDEQITNVLKNEFIDDPKNSVNEIEALTERKLNFIEPQVLVLQTIICVFDELINSVQNRLLSFSGKKEWGWNE